MLKVESLFSVFGNSGLFSYHDSKLAKLMMFILVLDFKSTAVVNTHQNQSKIL